MLVETMHSARQRRASHGSEGYIATPVGDASHRAPQDRADDPALTSGPIANHFVRATGKTCLPEGAEGALTGLVAVRSSICSMTAAPIRSAPVFAATTRPVWRVSRPGWRDVRLALRHEHLPRFAADALT